MQTFTINDPHNRENPLTDFSGDLVIYHGTTSAFSREIEEEGFCFNRFKNKYVVEMEKIIAACEKLYFKPGGFAAASGFSQSNCVYFSLQFLSARGYALNAGGERMDGAIRAADAFLEFANNEHRIARKTADLEAALKKHGGPHVATERVLSNLRNSDFVRALAEEVAISRVRLRAALSESNPIVYAVTADEPWIHELATDPDEDWNKEPFGGIKLTEVAASRIVARINYPSGISPDSE